MERQNITLSLPKDLLKRVKFLAVEKETSVSGLLAKYLEQLLTDEIRCRQAEKRIEERLETGYPLGTEGKRAWTREEHYER